MELEKLMEKKYDEWIDQLSRTIAKARFGPGVDMGGKHNPTPSEIRAAKDFIDFHIVPAMMALTISQEMELHGKGS